MEQSVRRSRSEGLRKEPRTNCFVLLKRLDKNILARHLQKRQLSSTAKRRHDERVEGRDRSLTGYRKIRGSHKDIREGDSEKSALKGGERKTGADDDSSRGNPNEKVLQETGDDEVCGRSAASSSGTPSEGLGSSENNSDSGTSHKRVISEDLTDKASINERSEGSFCEFPRGPLKPHAETCEILGKDRVSLADEMDVMTKSEEKDDVMRYAAYKRAVERRAGTGMAEEWGKKAIIKLERDADDAPAERQKSVDEDGDVRDEDEDDRATVIFEASFDKGTTGFYEVLEEIRSVKKKFGKKKITNRKKRTLVKFKRRRSMVGRNFARVKKVRNACSEVGCSGQQRAEKAVESAVGESYLREVCGLIKRLHELHRIILQLQEDLPKNSEHAEHFKRTINVQQENFWKEIRKHGKAIIGGYERMVKRYRNANTVAREIAKRTSLTKEDIANVISRCTPAGEVSQEKGRTAGTEEPEPNSSREASPKGFGITPAYSKKQKKLIDDKIEAILLAETAQSVRVEKSAKEAHDSTTEQQPGSVPLPQFVPVLRPPAKSPQSVKLEKSAKEAHDSTTEQQPGSVPLPQFFPVLRPPAKSPGEFRTASHQVAGENPAAAPSLSNHFLRGSLSQCANFQWQWAPHSKVRPHFYPQRPRGAVGDPRPLPQDLTRFNPRHAHGTLPQPFPPRPVHDPSQNFRPRPRGPAFLAPPYLPNNSSTIGLFHAGFVPLAPARTTPFPIPSLIDLNPYLSGHNLGRLPVNRFPHVPNTSLSSTDVRPAPPQQAFDRCGNMPSQSGSQKHSTYSRRRQVFPSSKGFGCSADGAPGQAFPREGQSSLRTILSTFSKYLQPNAPKYPTQVPTAPAYPEGMCSTSTTQGSTSEKPGRCILDPTVPQKLTMRNRRLEAGPVLETAGESWKSGWHYPSTEEAISKDDGGGSNPKDSNSRVYVCAQNGCKNAGVRICRACRSVIYCSEACQLKHWATKHKSECHQLKELQE